MQEHIEQLRRLADCVPIETRAAVLAAIALMNAAKPLDEAAETRVCEAICLPLAAAKWLESVDAVRAGRAQTRAEGYASGRAVTREVHAEAMLLLLAQLSAARAEIQQLELEADKDDAKLGRQETELRSIGALLVAAQGVAENRQRVNNNLAAMLSAARREIENQQSQVADLQRLGQELETKLANLRTAAEQEAT